MRPELVQASIRSTAAALIIGAFFLLLGGGALSLGWSFRSTLEPLLHQIRSASPLSRSELADASVVAAIAFAVLAVFFDHPAVALVLAVTLWLGRPLVRRATSEENRLLALGQSFSLDLVIGFYLPIVAAQLLLLNYFTAASMALIVVALSWPPTGSSLGRRSRYS